MASGPRKTILSAGWHLALAAAAFRLAAPVFGLLLGYLVYVVLSGQVRQVSPQGEEILRTVGILLVVSGALATASLILLTLEEIAWAVLAGILGVLCLLGMPSLVISAVGISVGPGAQIISYYGSLAGQVIVGLVILRVLYELYLLAALRKDRQRREELRRERDLIQGKRGGVTHEKVLARCWEMPFCHQAIREFCPAFKARRSCWRFGRGCNCDPAMIDRMIRMRTPVTARTRGTEGEYLRSDLQADQPVRPGQRTITCAKCPIYTEHQRRKFKVVSPVAVLGTLALFVGSYGVLTNFYSDLAWTLARFASGMALGPTGSSVEWWQEYLDTPLLQGAFVLVLGVFVLAWVLRAAEWLVLEKKLL